MQTTRPTVPACLAPGLLISVAGKRGGEAVFAGGEIVEEVDFFFRFRGVRFSGV